MCVMVSNGIMAVRNNTSNLKHTIVIIITSATIIIITANDVIQCKDVSVDVLTHSRSKHGNLADVLKYL